MMHLLCHDNVAGMFRSFEFSWYPDSLDYDTVQALLHCYTDLMDTL